MATPRRARLGGAGHSSSKPRYRVDMAGDNSDVSIGSETRPSSRDDIASRSMALISRPSRTGGIEGASGQARSGEIARGLSARAQRHQPSDCPAANGGPVGK